MTKPPDKCLTCAAWEQQRHVRGGWEGCGATIVNKQRGCLKDAQKEKDNAD